MDDKHVKITKPFAVVYFKSDQTYSEIPVSWLSSDRQTCIWPKTRNPTAFMHKGIQPDGNETNWETFDVRVETYCSTLESARKKAELGPEYSSAEETVLKGRGRRTKFLKRRETTSSSDQESEVTVTPPPTPVKGAVKKVLSQEPEGVPPLMVINSELGNTEQNNNLGNDDGIETLFVDSSPNRNEDATSMNINEMPLVLLKDNISLTELYMALVDLTKICSSTQEYVKSIERKLKSKCSIEGMESFSAYFKTLESKLPFKSIDALKAFDKELLENEKMKEIFTKYVNKIGGDDAKDAINRTLKAVFSNELAKNCSWLGRNDNFAVQPLYVTKLITDIIIMQHDTTLSVIQHYASEWFRLANQRLQREIKKLNSKKNVG